MGGHQAERRVGEGVEMRERVRLRDEGSGRGRGFGMGRGLRLGSAHTSSNSTSIALLRLDSLSGAELSRPLSQSAAPFDNSSTRSITCWRRR